MVTALVEGSVFAAPAARVPALILVAPEYVLAPLNVTSCAPIFESDPDPVMTLGMENGAAPPSIVPPAAPRVMPRLTFKVKLKLAPIAPPLSVIASARGLPGTAPKPTSLLPAALPIRNNPALTMSFV
jgi:hypothetical protein